jgi:hypothetical protein
VQNVQNLKLAVEIAVEYTDTMGDWENILGRRPSLHMSLAESG